MAGALNFQSGALCGDTIVLAIQTVEKALTALQGATTLNKLATALYVDDPVGDLKELAQEEMVKPIVSALGGLITSIEEGFSNQYVDALTDKTLDPNTANEGPSEQYFNTAYPPDYTWEDNGPVPLRDRELPPEESAEACERVRFQGMLSGPLNSVGQLIGSTAKDVSNLATGKFGGLSKSALSTLGSAGTVMSSVPGVFQGFAQQAMATLTSVYDFERQVMLPILEIMDQIISDLERIPKASRGSNHFLTVSEAQRFLIAAEGILQREETIVATRGAPQSQKEREQGQQLTDAVFRLQAQTGQLARSGGIPDAQRYMRLSEELLCSKEMFPNLRGSEFLGRILGLLATLQGIRTILSKSFEESDLLDLNLKNFDLNLQTNFSVTNFFGGTLHRVRCELLKIIDAMDGALNKNDLTTYLVKEKEWCLKVKILRNFLDLAVSTPSEALSDFFDTNAGKSIVDASKLLEGLNAGDYQKARLIRNPDIILLDTTTVPLNSGGDISVQGENFTFRAQYKAVDLYSELDGAVISEGESNVLAIQPVNRGLSSQYGDLTDDERAEIDTAAATGQADKLETARMNAAKQAVVRKFPSMAGFQEEASSFLPAGYVEEDETGAGVEVSVALIDPNITSASLITTIDKFIEITTIRLQQSGQVTSLQALRNDAEKQITALNQRKTPLEEALLSINSSPFMEQNLAMARKLSAGISAFRAFSGIAANLANLKWAEVFNHDSITTSLDGLAAAAMAKAKDCCEGAAQGTATGLASLSAAAVTKMGKVIDDLIDSSREEAIEDETEGGFTSEESQHLAQEADNIAKKLRDLQTVRKAPCFNSQPASNVDLSVAQQPTTGITFT